MSGMSCDITLRTAGRGLRGLRPISRSTTWPDGGGWSGVGLGLGIGVQAYYLEPDSFISMSGDGSPDRWFPGSGLGDHASIRSPAIGITVLLARGKD